MTIESTDFHIRGYSGIVEPCVGKATVNLKLGQRCHAEEVFFSKETTGNFLSRDACKAFGIIPRGFPHEQLNAVKLRQRTRVLEEYFGNPIRLEKYSQNSSVGEAKLKKTSRLEEYSGKPMRLEEYSQNSSVGERILKQMSRLEEYNMSSKDDGRLMQ